MYSSESRPWPVRNFIVFNAIVTVFNAIATVLADCAKFMVVHVLLRILIYGN